MQSFGFLMVGWLVRATCTCEALINLCTVCRLCAQPHFGIALDVESFHQLSARLREKGVKFIIEVRQQQHSSNSRCSATLFTASSVLPCGQQRLFFSGAVLGLESLGRFDWMVVQSGQSQDKQLLIWCLLPWEMGGDRRTGMQHVSEAGARTG